MSSPDVSIVIVNWNTRDRLADCLDSVERATRDLVSEIIVVDNGSSDGSSAMVRARFPRAQLIENPTNVAFATGGNQGLVRARGRYLLLLNSDTIIRSDAIQRVVRFMNEHPRVGLLGVKLLNPNGSFQASFASFPTLASECLSATTLGERVVTPRYPSPLPDPMEAPREVDWIVGAFMLARRAAWEAVGGLDEGFRLYSEDTDWCYRMGRAGWKVVYLPDVEVVHVQGASTRQQAVESKAQLYWAKVRFFTKHYGARRALVLRGALWTIFLARGALSWIMTLFATSAGLRERWRQESIVCRRVRAMCVHSPPGNVEQISRPFS